MIRRVVLGLLALAVLLIAAVGTYAAGLYQGWLVERMGPSELSDLLRPHDRILRPEGRGPFPTALLFSGCDGPKDNMVRWARMLEDAGWASIIVDSNTPRDRIEVEEWRPICRGQTFWGSERAGDILVSLSDARAMPFVDPDRIVLIGSSHGAWSIMELFVFDPPEALPYNLSGPPSDIAREGLGGVIGSILLYPFCGIVNRARGSGWRHPAPALFLLSGEDALAPAEDCLAIADELAENGKSVTLKVFPGVTHGFDQVEREPGSDLRFDEEATARALAIGRGFLDGLTGGPSR